jgi:putative ABC transport system ATP-binding protein
MDLILALHRDYGTTLVLVTHDPAVATLMHRVIALRDGRIESDDILSRPAGQGESSR